MAHGRSSLSRVGSMVGVASAALALGTLAPSPVGAQQVISIKGPLWSKTMLNNQYQLYRVNFNQATSNAGNVATITWPAALMPAWMQLSAYDDSKDDANGGLLAIGAESYVPNPLVDTITGFPNSATAIIKVRNLTPVALSPQIQWYTLSTNAASLTWVAPATFGRVAGGIVWTNGNTQGTVNLLNTGGVSAHDVTLTILNASRQAITSPVAVVSAVGPRGALALKFTVPSGVGVGTQLYLQLNYHAAGEAGTTAFAIYVGQ